MRPSAAKKSSGQGVRRYRGKLAIPIRILGSPPTFSGAVTGERAKRSRRKYRQHQEKVEAFVRDQREERIRLLHKHYGIPSRDMEALALALAEEHVAGFKVIDDAQQKRGRKKLWDGPKLQALYYDVQAVRAGKRCSDRQALKVIAKDPSFSAKWAAPNGRDPSKWLETLESRLSDAKRYVRFIESLPGVLSEITNRIIK
jgi:hypothetical protein